MALAVAGISLTALTACGGSARPAARHGGGKAAGSGAIDLGAAALPYDVLDGRTGKTLSDDALLDALAGARAVCIGETHSNPHHHWLQLRLVDALSRRAAADGRELALGMEMFQLPFQHVLDDYASGAIGEPALLGRAQWHKRWGYDFGLYRPIIAVAREHGAVLLALNAAKEITRTIGREGIDALTDDQRSQLPADIVLDDADHRAWFDEIMQGHPGEEGGAMPVNDNIYTAQVVWDETMAATAAAWLDGGAERQIIILAGHGHCHDSAIVGRIKRRGHDAVVSVHPVIDDGEGNVPELFEPSRNDYIVAMKIPAK